MLIISKAYGKEAAEYKAKQAHVELVNRIKKRDPEHTPHIGDRIPYVIIASVKNAKAFEKVEDPMYVLEKNLQVDSKYYIKNQVCNFVCLLGTNGK